MKGKDKTEEEYDMIAISSPRRTCPKCGHVTGGTRFVKRKKVKPR